MPSITLRLRITHHTLRGILLLALCCTTLCLQAETKDQRMQLRHELRLGWGDQLFESLVWHNPTHTVSTMPESWQQTSHEDYHYNQHLWAEYHYRVNGWFSAGGMLDMSEVGWTDMVRNGKGAELSRTPNRYFYNLVLMSTIRFTYFHHPYVNLYSGLGLGIGINGGTETNAQGKHTDAGAALQVTVLGLSANWKRWCWSVDLGGLYSLKNANTIFMASSRIISVGIGVRL